MRSFIRNILLLLIGAMHVQAGLLHRYSFNGEGVVAVDSVGGKDGALQGGVRLKSQGYLDLDGVNDFVELPQGVLGGTGSATFEVWTIWEGPSTSSWQNLVHFSESDRKYLSLTPRAGTGSKHVRFGISSGGAEKRVDGLDQLRGYGATLNHLVLAYDGGLGSMTLYVDGVLQKTASTSVDLKSITPVNCWLGKSVYTWAPYYKGRILEFRIHENALMAAKVKTSYDFGPDELPGPRIKSFVVSQAVVRSGTKVTLNYECEDAAATLTLEPGGLQLAGGKGSAEVTVAATTRYVLSAQNDDGVRTAAVEVVVDDRPEIRAFTVDPDTVGEGQPVMLGWDVAYADIVKIDKGAPAISGGKGSVQVTPAKSTRYTLTALNAAGQTTAFVRVSVRGTNEVVINEVHHDPDSPTELTEFIELYNYGLTEVDLSGWSFSSGLSYIFPEGSVLARGGYLVIAQDKTHFYTRFKKNPFGVFAAGRLSNGGERITLRDAVGNKIDEIDYKSEFPWPISPAGRGPSMELLNPSLDNNLAGSWRASVQPTPGDRNSVHTDNAPPQIRQVRQLPQQPRDYEQPIIRAKVSDPDLVQSVELLYQVVRPGQYFGAYQPKSFTDILGKPDDPHAANSTFEAAGSWTTVAMAPDAEAGESIFSATLPAQPNRTLVRYRIRATDREGASVRVPYPDDPSLNFAYFVYNGVPDYVASTRSVHPDGAGHVHPSAVMTSLPVYHLVTDSSEYTQCYAYSGDKIPKSNSASRSAFHWYGTFVYEGVVYDHIRYRLRQANDRYSNIVGKRSMRFRFNRGNLFQARDLSGNTLPYKVRTINTGKMFDNKDVGNFGLTETMNSLLWNMTGVPAPHTWWFHFRVVKSQQEQSSQYHGDFQGFHLVFENYDPTFIKTHRLPDGNLYKLKDRIFDGSLLKRHQGTASVTDDSDFQNIRRNLRPERTADWLNANVNYDKAYRYHTVNEAVRHFDVQPADSHSKNRAWFFAPHPDNPLGRLWTLPWDSDASWGPNWGNGIDYSHNAAIIANGGKPDFVRDYRNFVREFRDLLWTEEVISPLMDRLADRIRDFVPADRDRWKDAPADAGRQDFGTMEWKLQDMKNFAFVGWSGQGGPDVPAGGRAKRLDDLARDNAIPRTPTLSYTGPVGTPLDGIQLKSTAFSDPQGNNTFGSIQWRVAEVAPIAVPDLISGKKPLLEWYADWDSGTLDIFADTVRVPARNLGQGRTYRARVRHQDNTGRWSHWSAPVEIVPGAPAALADLQRDLAIAEIHYAPAPPTSAETAAGYTAADFEFIELKNVGTSTLDLSDVRLTKGVDFDFAAGIQLDAGALLLVVGNQAAFESRYGKDHPVAGVFTGKLADGGENLKLSLGPGAAIHEIDYDNKAPWPVKAGHSLVLAPLAPGSVHANPVSWNASDAVGGTPGRDEVVVVATPQVRITEFMAINGTAHKDASGDTPDWVEIHNPGNTDADLAGWTLTDDPRRPDLWKFPDGTILAKGARLIVFASGRTTASVGELHATFKLSGSKGGFLALANPAGSLVQMFHDYPAQREDFSYGLADDGGLVRYFDKPTPGQPNGTGILGFVKDTRFSHDRGFYERPFELTIKTYTADALIHYTTDGSKPSAQNGTRYSTPIPISTTMTLRAIAFKSGYVPTNIDTHTYLFPADILRQPANPAGFPAQWNGHPADYAMDPDIVNDSRWKNDLQNDLRTIPSLSLVLDRDDIFHAQTGIYPKGESVEKSTSVELIHPDGSKGFQIDGSVQIAGGSSVNRWKSEKLSMRLKFTSEYGPPSLKHPVFGEDAAKEFDTLVVDARLNNVWSYGGGADPVNQRRRGQYLRDQYAADLQRKLGGDAPHGFNIHLYIDGLYWGLHTLHERPDENFVHQYRGGGPDDYHVMKHRTSTVVHGDGSAYQTLVSAANQNLSVKTHYERVRQLLAIQPFIEYMLINFYLGNTDWGHQNWYASTHRNDPARNWRFHCWDAEHIMESLNQNATTRNNNGGPTRIHQQLKANAEYKTLFADLTFRHFYNDGILSPVNAAAHYRDKAAIIERAIIAESARWGDNQRAQPYTQVDWVAERDNLLNNYFPKRRDIVIQQLRNDGAYPSIDPPAFAQRGGEVASGFKLALTAAKGDIYYTLDGSDPRLEGGAPASTASKYVGDIALDGPSAQVRVRTRFGTEWSAIDQATFIVEPAKPTSATLAITEILYQPIAATAQEKAAGFEAADFEFIEIRNLDKTRPIALSGLKFTSGIEFTFPAGLVLDPGARAVLVANQRAFASRSTASVTILGEFQGKLSNGGETLRLLTAEGAVVQGFRYDNNAGWPAGADGGGKSIVLLDPETQPDPSSPSSWKASAEVGGSPGEEESSTGSDGDSDGLPDDWESTHFGNLDQPHDGDFDKDGLPNLLEFALGSSPAKASERNLPQVSLSADGYVTLTWIRPEAAGNLLFSVETSPDLKSWTSGQTTLVSSTTTDGLTTTTVRDNQSYADSSLRFLRLVVTTQ